MPCSADVEHLAPGHAQLAQHHLEDARALAHAVLAGREDAVDLQSGERGPVEDPAQLAVRVVGVGHEHEPGAALLLGQLGEPEDLEVGERDGALVLDLGVGQVMGARPVEDVGSKLVPDLLEADLGRRPVSGQVPPGSPLRGLAEPPEHGGGELGRQPALFEQALAQHDEGVDRFRDGAPQERVEHVEGEDGDVLPLEHPQPRDQARILRGLLGQRLLLDGRHDTSKLVGHSWDLSVPPVDAGDHQSPHRAAILVAAGGVATQGPTTSP